MGKEIVLPGPAKVFRELVTLIQNPDFLRALMATFLRGMAAFALSTLAGSALGILAGLSPIAAAALAPLLTIIRATPVLALILLALLWFPSNFVPVFSAFLMAFPVMAANAAEGARACDPRLLEMSRLFCIPKTTIFIHLRLPSATPHLLAGARGALGLSWKVVVAGEVLSQPIHALGTGMQEARVLLETPRVFAWATASILLCGLTEWLFSLVTKKVFRRGI